MLRPHLDSGALEVSKSRELNKSTYRRNSCCSASGNDARSPVSSAWLANARKRLRPRCRIDFTAGTVVSRISPTSSAEYSNTSKRIITLRCDAGISMNVGSAAAAASRLACSSTG
jgi:hypothetical protein